MDTTMTPSMSIYDVILAFSNKITDLGKYQKAVRVKPQVKGLIQSLKTQFTDFIVANSDSNVTVETVQPVVKTVVQEVKEPVSTVSKIEVVPSESNYAHIEATSELPNMQSVKGHRLVLATEAFLGVIKVHLNSLIKKHGIEEIHNDIPSPKVEESIISKVSEPEFMPYTQPVDLGIPSVVTNTVEVSEPTVIVAEKSNIMPIEATLQNLNEGNVEISLPAQETKEVVIEENNSQSIESVLKNMVEQPTVIQESVVVEPIVQNEIPSDAIKEDVSVAEVISNIRGLTEKVASAEKTKAKDDQTIVTLQGTVKKQRENVLTLTASNRDLEDKNKALQKQNQALLAKATQLEAEIVKVQASADQKIANILTAKESEHARDIATLKNDRANLIKAFAAASSYTPAETELRKAA